MKTLLLSICLLLGMMQAKSQVLVIDWQKSYGGIGNERGKSIVQTSDGGYAIAAATASNNGDVSGNQGYGDVWVIKISSVGAIVREEILYFME